MGATLAQLAELVSGEVLGDSAIAITGAASLVDATSGDITLVDTSSKTHLLAASCARAVVVPASFDASALMMPAIRVSDIHKAFSAIVRFFRPPRAQRRCGIHSQAIVSQSARLAADVDIHAGAIVGDDTEIGTGSVIYGGAHVMSGCKIGDHVTIFPNATLYENSIIGPRCLIHAGVVIGGYGFGYKLVGGCHERAAQLGYVEIGADVEIGAGTTVDRGTYGPTVIGDGTKIDNLVMIAHNCRIGRHNLICSQVGIAGSTTTGDHVVMAGQVGVRDHVHIGARAVLSAMCGITNDVPDGACMMGIPATEEREQKVRLVTIAKLPEMRRQLKQLQQIVDAMLRDGGSRNAAA